MLRRLMHFFGVATPNTLTVAPGCSVEFVEARLLMSATATPVAPSPGYLFEGGGSASFNAQVTVGMYENFARTFSVGFSFTGAATAGGVDHTGATIGSLSVTVAANSLTGTGASPVTIQALSDGISESGGEAAVFTITSVTNGQPSQNPSATVMIYDGMAPPVPGLTLEAADAGADETGSNPGAFRITRTGSTPPA